MSVRKVYTAQACACGRVKVLGLLHGHPRPGSDRSVDSGRFTTVKKAVTTVKIQPKPDEAGVTSEQNIGTKKIEPDLKRHREALCGKSDDLQDKTTVDLLV